MNWLALRILLKVGAKLESTVLQTELLEKTEDKNTYEEGNVIIHVSLCKFD